MRRSLRARMTSIGVALTTLILTSCAAEMEPRRTADDGDTSAPGLAPVDDRLPVVLDGDFGPDDMMALLYLLNAPDVDVLAVTVSGTGLVHCPAGAVNAAAILAAAGHDEIPVACGQSAPVAGTNAFPDEWRFGADRLAESLSVPVSTDTGSGSAIDLLIETVENSDRPVHLLVLGPMTNVAVAIEAHPQVVDNIARVVAMGGALEVAGSVAPAYRAEWNLWVDPVAANTVLDSGVAVELVPLDATNDVPATPFFLENLQLDRHTPEADLIYKYFARNGYTLEGGSYFFWDPLAAVSMVEPEVVATELRRVMVVEEPGDDIGALIESPNGVESRVSLSADRHTFEETFLSTINGGETVRVEIPVPVISVRYTGEACTFDGTHEFESTGTLTRVIVELVNETETPFSIVTSLHEGITWEQVTTDATMYLRSGELPGYWQETGSLGLYGKSVTGGRTVGAFDLRPGAHALVCGSEDGRVFALADLVVGGSVTD